eukprot:m.56064 g.56064  ORF g.56064 m.56064 type:complete len:62 (-) comp11536_c2_seq2:227-412(-)
MPQDEVPTPLPASEAQNKKPCCACPETKKPRDKCIMEHGEGECYHLIAAHLACMRALGFKL